jgi:hypothetical protein
MARTWPKREAFFVCGAPRFAVVEFAAAPALIDGLGARHILKRARAMTAAGCFPIVTRGAGISAAERDSLRDEK